MQNENSLRIQTYRLAFVLPENSLGVPPRTLARSRTVVPTALCLLSSASRNKVLYIVGVHLCRNFVPQSQTVCCDTRICKQPALSRILLIVTMCALRLFFASDGWIVHVYAVKNRYRAEQIEGNNIMPV